MLLPDVSASEFFTHESLQQLIAYRLHRRVRQHDAEFAAATIHLDVEDSDGSDVGRTGNRGEPRVCLNSIQAHVDRSDWREGSRQVCEGQR